MDSESVFEGFAKHQSWITGTGISGLVYYLACLASPPPGMNKHFQEIDESAHEPRPGHAGVVHYGEDHTEAYSRGVESSETGSNEEKNMYVSSKKSSPKEKVSVLDA